MTTRKLLAVALLAVAALGCIISPAWSCSDVAMTNTTLYDAIISARNYDFFAQLVLKLVFVVIPAGTAVQYTPLVGCQSPGGLSTEAATSKYGYVGVSMGRVEFVVGFGLLCRRTFKADTFAGAVVEGFNTAGLSVGALVDESAPFPPNATSLLGQKPGIYFNDLAAFLLATYGSVAEIKAKFTSDNYRLVNNPPAFDVIFKLSPKAATRVSHYALHDASGAAGVLEFTTDKNGAFSWVVRDNPGGVLTNSPALPTQLAYANEFQQGQINQFGPKNGLIMTPGFCGVGWNITTWENNNCNSMGRFTVLKMLKDNVANTRFPDPLYKESPAANPDPAHKATIAALRMLDWVKVPGHWPSLGSPGAPPANTIIGVEEMTIMSFVKNHRRLIWYVRTAANEQWVQFDLKRIFNVPSLETRTSAVGEDDDDDDQAEISRRKYGGSSGSRRPRAPVFKDVGNVVPPVRRWATDKTDDLLYS